MSLTQGSLSAAAPVMVILSVLTIVFLAISIGLYVKFTRYKEEIHIFNFILVMLNINHVYIQEVKCL